MFCKIVLGFVAHAISHPDFESEASRGSPQLMQRASMSPPLLSPEDRPRQTKSFAFLILIFLFFFLVIFSRKGTLSELRSSSFSDAFQSESSRHFFLATAVEASLVLGAELTCQTSNPGFLAGISVGGGEGLALIERVDRSPAESRMGLGGGESGLTSGKEQEWKDRISFRVWFSLSHLIPPYQPNLPKRSVSKMPG